MSSTDNAEKRLNTLGMFTTLLITALMGSARAQEPLLLEVDLGATGSFESTSLGTSMATDGVIAVVGDTGYNTHAGAVVVYRNTGGTWAQEQVLTASDGDDVDAFGCDVAIEGDVIVVGAYGQDDFVYFEGAVYVFRHDGTQWLEEQRLKSSTNTGYDSFGYQVAISGDVIVASAPGDGKYWGLESEGAAFVFRHNGSVWNEEAVLLPSFYKQDARFGQALRMDKGRILVGSDWGTWAQENSGRVFVFEHDGNQWTEVQMISASDAATDDHFGWDLAVHGDIAVMGAYGDDDSGETTGSVYLFRHDGNQWIEEQKILAPSASYFGFGYGVEVHDDRIIVNSFSPATESLYTWNQSSWVESQVINPIDGSDFYSAALIGDCLFAGGGGKAHILTPADFRLAAYPETALEGETLYFRACKAMPSSPVLLFVVDVNGIPVFQRILFAFFDSDGWLNLSAPVPSGLTGLTMDLKAYGKGTAGTIQSTNTVHLEFE